MPFTPPADLDLERTPKGKKVETMLADGELDAVIAPNAVAPFVRKDPRVKRLFENYHEYGRVNIGVHDATMLDLTLYFSGFRTAIVC